MTVLQRIGNRARKVLLSFGPLGPLLEIAPLAKAADRHRGNGLNASARAGDVFGFRADHPRRLVRSRHAAEALEIIENAEKAQSKLPR